jgi:multidrug efflux pump subunit AcrA (membrane-fusion protein)
MQVTELKKLKLMVITLLTISLLALAAGCSSKASTTTTKSVTYVVKQGNISLEVVGTGNLALANTEDLSFDMAGTVEEVLVTDGETVTEGQELARLDTTAWEDQITILKETLTNSKRSLVNAQRDVAAKQLALRQAELNVTTAEEELNEINIVKDAQAAVDNAEEALETANTNYSSDPATWAARIVDINKQLAEAKTYLNEVLSGASMNVSGDVSLQISKRLLEIDQNDLSLENAKTAVGDANSAVTDAEAAVTKAQDKLDEAQNLGPTITAPFAGFITKVDISGGDEVQKGTVAMQLANPDNFKANIQVTEQDIFSVNVGSGAIVTVDALSNKAFPATITSIAPLATVSQGVVTYKVTVELNTDRTTNTNTSIGNGAATANMTPPYGFSISGTTAGTSTETSLKDGLSATVTIILDQASNVLVVPSRAISRQGQAYTVQVKNGETTETRAVKIGTSDDSNTEITEGLTEGETIVYTSSSSSSSSSNSGNQNFPGGGMGDMGGGPPGGF